MNEEPQHQTNASGDELVPWQRHGVEKEGYPSDQDQCFQVTYKKSHLIFFIVFFSCLIWMGFYLFNEDTSEVFLAIAPVLIAPLIMRYFRNSFLFILIILVAAMIGLAVAGFGQFLGKITVIVLFFIFIPSVILNQLFMLIDQRPQLIIDDEGMRCRQYGEDVIPWEHIRNVYVSTYQHHRWLPEQKTLMISLKDPSFYPASDGVFAPRRWLHTLEALFSKSIGRTELPIGGLFLDPPLPYAMKAIEHFRPDHKPKRSRKKSA